MEQRLRSPRYPSVALDEAEGLARRLFQGDGLHAVDRDVAVGHMGYSSLNGASAQMLSSLTQYALVENAGKSQLRLTSLALDLIEPQSDDDRAKAVQQAAWSPRLFSELRERFPNSTPSEGNLRAHLIRQQFTPSAIKAVIPAYLRTCEYVASIVGFESHGGVGKSGQTSGGAQRPKDTEAMTQHSIAQLNPPPPPMLATGLRREVFGLEEGEVMITLPARLSAESIEDVEAWLKIITRKLRRVATSAVSTPALREKEEPALLEDDDENADTE